MRVEYSYNLNDGNGEQSDVAAFTVTTLPEFEFTSFQIINTSAVSEGEEIVILATVYNPANATFTSVVINGVEYAVDTSTDTSMYVRITNNGQFAGGETLLTVEKIVVTLAGAEYTIIPDSNNSDTVFINGALYADSIEFADSSYEVVTYGDLSDTLYVKLNLTNPTGYEVYSVTVNNSVITSGIVMGETAETWYIPYSFSRGVNNITVTSVKYKNDSVDRETNVALSAVLYGLESSDPVYISTADDLLDMDDYRLYVLTADIDLSGIEWDGGSFNGVLLGEGYSIKNMRVVTTLDGGEYYLGLFKEGQGLIYDLTIDGATYVINFTGEDVTVYYGSVVARASGSLYIQNTHVVNSVVSFTGDDVEYIYAGGLVGHNGYSNSVTIIESSSAANITANGYVGGIIGFGSDYVVITDSCNTGNITGASEIGGLVGYGYGIIITGSYNSGTVTGTERVGGLVGQGYGATITDSYNSGAVTGTSSVGGLVGAGDSATITGSYNEGTVSGTDNIGGLIGSGSSATITDSYNEGAVTGTSNYVGGLIGYGYGAIIRYSYNAGAVTGTSYYVGGLVGYGDSATITNSYNEGTVTGFYDIGGLVGYGNATITGSCNEGVVAGAYIVGGLVGAGDSVTITGSYNIGDISGTDEVGGLVGGGSATITGSYNIGDVTGARNVGGLAGYGDGAITGSYNEGAVTGTERVGGLVGNGGGTITDSYNEGAVSGTNGVGGLVGQGHSVTITNSYNYGDVSGTEDVGDLIGYGTYSYN